MGRVKTQSLSLIISKISLLALLCASANLWSAEQNLPVETIEGLRLVEDRKADVVYVKPDVDFRGYTKFLLEFTDVRFVKNWQRERSRELRSGRISDRDVERIKRRISDMFYDVFAEELQKNDNFLVVSQPGDDVLAIRAAIINLDITAPDVQSPGRTRVYVANAGSATLVAEFSDSVSGEILARAADHKRARDSIGGFQSFNVNSQEARRALRAWARLVREAFEDVHGL